MNTFGTRKAPKWARGPNKAAKRGSLKWSGKPWEWSSAAAHVEEVWNMLHASTGGFEFEFAAQIGRHVKVCGMCETPAVLSVWTAVLPKLGMTDVLKAHTYKKDLK